MKMLFYFITFISLTFECLAQKNILNLTKASLISESKDTLFYSQSSKEVYNYFTNRYDSIYFDNVFCPTYITRIRISKNTGNGYCNIYTVDKKKITFIEVNNFEINGLGYVYDTHSNKMLYSSTFCNGKLNGITITYMNSYQIKSIALYKKGKYKKHLYHKFKPGVSKLKNNIPFKKYVISL